MYSIDVLLMCYCCTNIYGRNSMASFYFHDRRQKLADKKSNGNALDSCIKALLLFQGMSYQDLSSFFESCVFYKGWGETSFSLRASQTQEGLVKPQLNQGLFQIPFLKVKKSLYILCVSRF